MNENLKAVMRAASEDDALMSQASALMNELNGATEETRPQIVACIVTLAQERGFELTEDDLVVGVSEEGKIEDEELAAVAGGCSDYCAMFANDFG